MLARQSGTKQIIMITDGEPTAHIEPSGDEPFFNYPPVHETVDATLHEVARCTREGIRINTFMLDATSYLRHSSRSSPRSTGAAPSSPPPRRSATTSSSTSSSTAAHRGRRVAGLTPRRSRAVDRSARSGLASKATSIDRSTSRRRRRHGGDGDPAAASVG